MQTKHDANLGFFISDANAFYQDANAKCPYDAHVSFQRCNFHDAGVQMQSLSMMVLAHIFKLRCKCFLTEMEMQKSYNANALTQAQFIQKFPLF